MLKKSFFSGELFEKFKKFVSNYFNWLLLISFRKP
jgi:hypothetical protein